MNHPFVLVLKKDREFPVLRGHPWIYRESVRELPPGLQTGSEVELRSRRDEFLGRGYVDLESPILVRCLPARKEESLSACLRRLVGDSCLRRIDFFDFSRTTGYRLINGEGDGIPGLVVDRYGAALALQTYSSGLEAHLGPIVEALRESVKGVKWIWRRNQVRRSGAGGGGGATLLLGKDLPPTIPFLENGMKFEADLKSGQKTGFFLDQRDNRDMIRTLSRGRRLANICGYTGAFTVAAALGGAKETVTVDSARPALEEAKRSIQRNGLSGGRHEFFATDMNEFLDQAREGAFDLVVLDPPSMAKSRAELDRALRTYRRLNERAIRITAPGGVLFTASCSSQVSRDDFLAVLIDSAARARRSVRILAENAHAFDHPIALGHPEGRYLKGFFLGID